MGYQTMPGYKRRGGSFEHFKLTIGRNWLKGIVITWQIVAPTCGTELLTGPLLFYCPKNCSQLRSDIATSVAGMVTGLR